MKFSKTLRNQGIEAWKPYYINYKHLKVTLRYLKKKKFFL